jgi:hypothetical protein
MTLMAEMVLLMLRTTAAEMGKVSLASLFASFYFVPFKCVETAAYCMNITYRLLVH